jgi:phosphatidylglycerol:prolipoprotein diacylglycerol transferase
LPTFALSIEIPFDPDITSIGGLLITWHGLFTAVGILAGVQLALRMARIVNYDEDDAYTLALVGVPSGIVGARLLFVWERWDFYGSNPGEIIAITEGGISIWGAILGGILGALAFGVFILYLRAFGLILGQAIGRIGDLINGEHLAKASDLPWATFYTDPDSPAFAHSVTVGPHHPATTYELLGDLVILGVMFLLFFGVLRHRPGLVFSFYIVGYAVMRFFLTELRIDSAEVFAGLVVPQVVALVVVTAAAPLAVYLWRQPPRGDPGGDDPPPAGRVRVAG